MVYKYLTFPLFEAQASARDIHGILWEDNSVLQEISKGKQEKQYFVAMGDGWGLWYMEVEMNAKRRLMITTNCCGSKNRRCL